MTAENNPSVAVLRERIAELESRYLHLQRIVETLDEVVIEQGRKLDTLERHVAQLVRQIGSAADRSAEPRSLEEDKPPHY